MMSSDSLRKRKTVHGVDSSLSPDQSQMKKSSEIDVKHSHEWKEEFKENAKGSYWLTRIIIIRYIAFIYVVAFLVAYQQNEALLGSKGLLPANLYLDSIAARITPDVESDGRSVLWERVISVPTLFWFFDYGRDIDFLLNITAIIGLVISAVVMIRGAANIPLMLSLWFLYHSIVNVGQRWYSFGWESQLLETGFLAAFLCPLLSLSPLPRLSPPSIIILLAFRWLIFRIMIGAGLIKIRGDKCWRDLTCMNYHYETQPVPNPISYYMHQEPEMFHKFETLTNHFVELVAPVFLFLPRPMRIFGGLIQIIFQIVLIISGNLSFLNWLTIVPSLACLDDSFLVSIFSSSTIRRVASANREWKAERNKHSFFGKLTVRGMFNVMLGVLISYLSISIVQNLLSTRQIMNTSFDPFRLVNTYGAFGSVTKKRTEVIFEGTRSPDPQNAVWIEYEFKCKPGSTTRPPCLISPYHYRLDWLMWFAAFQNYNQNPWLIHLASKMLQNDNTTMSLIASNPFEGGPPPRWVRAEHYRYTFTHVSSNDSKGHWWKRKHIGNYLPPVSLRSVRDYVESMGWPVPRLDM